ncbi:MAG: hypothetical protein AAFR61_17150 [Bacteroidota bacterium]
MTPKKLLSVILLAFTFPLFTLGQSSVEETPVQAFDFWLGEWNVYKFGTDTLAGLSRIESILGGTAIQEHYETATGYKGTSLNKYNPALKRWEQYWIDNGGTVLHLKGAGQKGKMVMGNEQTVQGRLVKNEISWTRQEDGTVRQTWRLSQDGGENWSILFDGHYRPKK